MCNFVIEHNKIYYTIDPHQGKNFDHSPLSNEIDSNVIREQFDKIELLAKKMKNRYRLGPFNITVNEIQKFYQNHLDIRNYRCYMPWNTIGIGPYGDVHPCPHLNIGNLRDVKSLNVIWRNKKMKKFRRSLKKNKIYPVCIGCCQMEYIKK